MSFEAIDDGATYRCVSTVRLGFKRRAICVLRTQDIGPSLMPFSDMGLPSSAEAP